MKQTIQIRGMSCMHCQKRVKAALLAHQEVLQADVDFAAGTALVETRRPLTLQEVRGWVEEAGYGVDSLTESM